MSGDGSQRCTGVDIDSTPTPDQEGLERLLHLLRSTLARLKAEVQLAHADGLPPSTNVQATVDEALQYLDAVEDAVFNAAAGTPLTLLIIDDDLRLAGAMAQQLRRIGIIATGKRSLAELSAFSPNDTRIVVDLGVLRMADRRDLDRVLEFNPIVMSGSAEPLARLEASTYGAVAYLLKPVEPAKIVAALRRHSDPRRYSRDERRDTPRS